LIVADSALYTESNIKLISSLKWLTRVPLTIKSAKNLVMSLAELEFVKSEKAGYSYAEKKITYGDIEQRWLVVQSQDRKKSDLKKLSKRIEKAVKNRAHLRLGGCGKNRRKQVIKATINPSQS
jgi:transposase